MKEFGGAGTQEAPYAISTAEELAYLAEKVNDGETYANSYFILTADIDLNGKSWMPIGYGLSLGEGFANDISHAFAGNFDGKGYEVKNFTVTTSIAIEDNKQKYLSLGLFGAMSGTISNLTVSGNISCDAEVYTMSAGLIVGSLNGKATITDCHASGSIDLSKCDVVYAGAIVGLGNGVGSYVDSGSCETEMNLSATKFIYAGGVIGYSNYASVYAFNVTAEITATSNGSAYCAGVIGYANAKSSKIQNCIITCAISATGSSKYVNDVHNGTIKDGNVLGNQIVTP